MLAVLVAFLSIPVNAQFKLENWITHSSMFEIRSISLDWQGRIWAGASGGMFVYDPETNYSKEFRNIDALLSLDISLIRCNNTTKKIYIGAYDGTIDILDENFKFTHNTDIKSANFPNPVVNDIVFYGEQAFIGGGYGFSRFDLTNNVFIESAYRLGGFQTNSSVNKILLFNNEIWVATDDGVARTSLNNSSIADPNLWTTYGTAQGLPDEPIKFIIDYRNEIYVATNHYICKLSADTFSIVKSFLDYYNVNSLNVYNDRLYYSNQWYISDLEGNEHYVYYPEYMSLHLITADNSFIIGYKEQGIEIYKDGKSTLVTPNTPLCNRFNSLSVDNSGSLWVATDGKGIMRMKDNEWTNYTAKKYPEIVSDGYWTVYASPNDNRVICSNWGAGFSLIEPADNSYSITNYNKSNSPITGVASNPDWIVAGEARFDSYGRMWVVNYGEKSSGPLLIAKDKKDSYYTFENESVLNNRYYTGLEIDYSGTKWIRSNTEQSAGLIYFNDRGTLENTSDDIWGKLTDNNSALSDVMVNCLAVDHNGILWVGTAAGLCIVYNTSSILSKITPTVRKISLITEQPINCILVDALNYKWIGTNEGVWVINPDGNEVVEIITKKNAPLATNVIKSLATNVNTGQIFIGTTGALTEVTSMAIKPLPTYELSCYPQPFNPETDEQLVIEGLADDTQLKIVTISGELVKSIESSSRKALWDGRDRFGNFVSSGVYMVIVSSASSDEASVGKIAVIRK